MNFLLIYLFDTLGDYPDFEPIKIALGERTSTSGREIVEVVNKETSGGGFGVLGEFLFIDSVDAYRGEEFIIWNNSKMVKTFYWHLLSQNVRNGHSKVAKRSKCEDAPCCGCCDISDDGYNGYIN